MRSLYLPVALIANCPQPTVRTWLGAALFSGALVFLLLAALIGAWLWRKRSGETHDTAQRVAHNSAIPLAIQMATRAIEMGFLAVLYRVVCKSAIGQFDFAALLVVLYLGAFADFGLTVVTTRDVARDPSAAPRYFRAMLRLRTVLGLAAIPLALAVPALYSLLFRLGLTAEPLGGEQVVLIAILVLTLLPSGYSAAVTALFNATERLQLSAFLNLMTNIVSALLRVGALALGFGIAGVAVGSLLATVFSALIFELALRRTFGRIPLRGPGLAWRPLLAEGWPLMLNSLLLSVFFRFDSFIIPAYHGADALAAYAVTYKYINLTQILPPIVVGALFPLLSRRAVEDQAAFRHAYYYTLRLLLLLALPLATTMSLFAQPLVQILAPDYPESVTALAIIIWYLPFSYINGLTQYALIALGRQRVITAAFAMTALFNLAVNMVLVPIWGINAAAAVTVASEMVLYIPLHRALRQTVGAPPLLSMSWRPALASLAVALGILMARDASWLLALLLAAPLYLAGLLALRTFTGEDRLLLRRVLGRARLDSA